MLPVVRAGRLFCVGVLIAVLFSVSLAAIHAADVAGGRPQRDLAQQILKAAAFSGGLIVHVGCGDGKLTAALHSSDNCLIHGLEADAQKVRQAREYLGQLGVYGPVSVEQWSGGRLPYAENLVNLLVISDAGAKIADEEIARVLAPGGAAIRVDPKSKIQNPKFIKPRPKNVDEWTHYLHDPSGNPVAHDEVVGPPRRLQWVAPPRYTRSHEHIPGIYALVSTAGRIFYIADEAAIGSIRQTPQWNLLARDAYNGVLLWKQPVAAWFPHIVNWGSTPLQLERKLVAVGDRVYVSLGLHAPLSVLDAATGKVLAVYENTQGTEEILCHKGVLLLVVRAVTDQRVAELKEWAKLVRMDKSPAFDRDSALPLVDRLRKAENRADITLLALDAQTGRLLWKKEGESVSALKTNSLSANQDRVFYQQGKDTVCLNLQSGQELWSAAHAPLRVVSDTCVLCADNKTVAALSPETGQPQWTQPAPLAEVKDVFLAGGSLWLGGFQFTPPGKRSSAWGPYFATQHDLATGKMLSRIDPENPGHHHRCYANKATDRYILGGRRGTEFIDLRSGDVLWNSWARGVCKYGVMPCNGLLYVPPHACGCYIAVKLAGFNAMAPESEEQRKARSEGRGSEGDRVEPLPLQRGPAYASASNPQSLIPNPSDWPSYRHDAARSGATASALSAAELKCAWQTTPGGRLTSLTAADGKIFVASIDRHTISALDAKTGKPVWAFTAGGRVDTPPTIHQQRALFGCRDGAVYSLRVSDGALAWRLPVASQRRIVADGQLESVAPICGSVLIQDGAACFTSGRSSYLDGGIDLYRVEPATGKVLSKTAIYSPDPQTGKQPPQSAPATMPGARADILSADAEHIYLGDAVFDRRGTSQPEGNPHLFALTGFLDDSWAHRSYWIFGTHCSIATGCSGRDKNLIYGRLLVFDDAMVYGYGRATVNWSNQLIDGPYRLFARKLGEDTTQWTKSLPIQARAMVLAGKVLFAAGPAAEEDPWQQSPGAKQKGLLLAIATADGSVLAQQPLDGPPVFDGMAAAGGRLYIALENGQVVCMDQKKSD